jgi:Basic region leucine zipper
MSRHPDNFLGFTHREEHEDVNQWRTSESQWNDAAAPFIESNEAFNVPGTTGEFELQHTPLEGQFVTDPYFTTPINTVPRDSVSGSTASPTSSGPAFGVLGSPAATSDAGNADEGPTVAIAEDKRRRNTAASARFRVKKKEREAELERRAQDMTTRCDELRRRIDALETENRWLRELITERSRNRGRKGGKPKEPEKPSKGERAERASRKKVDDLSA